MENLKAKAKKLFADIYSQTDFLAVKKESGAKVTEQYQRVKKAADELIKIVDQRVHDDSSKGAVKIFKHKLSNHIALRQVGADSSDNTKMKDDVFFNDEILPLFVEV